MLRSIHHLFYSESLRKSPSVIYEDLTTNHAFINIQCLQLAIRIIADDQRMNHAFIEMQELKAMTLTQQAAGGANWWPIKILALLTLTGVIGGAVAESVERGPHMWEIWEFGSWSSQTNDLKSDTCRFLAWY